MERLAEYMFEFLNTIWKAREAITFVLSIFGFLWIMWAIAKSNRPRVKRIRYYLINKKIMVSLDAMREYPEFVADVKNLKTNIFASFESKGKTVEFPAIGKNYLQVLIKQSQAPIQIEFQPKTLPEDLERIVGTEVRIKLLGTIRFYYREDFDNLDYLSDMDDIFSIIEKEYVQYPRFRTFHLASAPQDFDEKWEELSRKSIRGAEVRIGKKVINVYASDISPLYEAYKRSITAV